MSNGKGSKRRPPNFEEVEMVVGIAGALTVYLLRKT